MAGLGRPDAVLSLLLVAWASPSTTDAAPSWDNPFMTADTTDKYIKEVEEANAVLTIYEDVPIGHKIGVLHITAQAGDTVVVTQEETDKVQLSFNGTNTEQNVYIQSVIDSEKADYINFEVLLNGGSASYFIIEVADVNDNTPTFDDQGSQISLDVPENHLSDSLLILTATDADIGVTAILTYSMDTGGFDSIFSLTSITKDGKPACQLGLLKELDFETRPLYKLTITVKDSTDVRGETRSSTVTVFVNVVDVADTGPRWLLPPMASSIDENLPQGTALFNVEAIDGDTDVNNIISYSIVTQTPDRFADIDPTTGKVTLKRELDREDPAFDEGGFISLVVQAREMPLDGPDQPCTAITCVNGTALITINDLDDNAPEFDQSSYLISFPENTSGAIDMLIDVTDKDSSFPNNLISLSLESAPEGVFELQTSEGAGSLTTYLIVTDKDYLDYESSIRRHIQFQMVAQSSSPNGNNVTANITINLEDVEEYPSDTEPKWDSPFITTDTGDKYIKGIDTANAVISAYEDVPLGHQIATLHIIAQEGNHVAVRQSAGEEDIQLSFNGTNFEKNVFIQSGIDREKTDFLTAGVSLNGGSTEYITFHVIDVNDNAPTFDGNNGYQISLTIPENHLNDSLLILTATDADIGATATLTYSMDTEGFDDRFALKTLTVDDKPGCQLQVNRGLDYETRPMYRLVVTVMDAPDDRGQVLNSSIRVFVNVQDTEDTAPRWLLPPRTVNIDERTPKGFEVFAVEALDGDATYKNDIRYSIVSQIPAGVLQLADKTSGKVTLAAELDRESPELAEGLVVAVIQAREVTSGNPDQPCTNITCSKGTAVITVSDLDDNPPEFDQSSYSVSFPSNTTGVLYLPITVIDRDQAAPNKAVHLSLSGVPDGVFTLTSNRGMTPLTTYIEVMDAGYLERQKSSSGSFSFKIAAIGDNANKLTSYADVTVNLES